jgi:peptidoglycan/LPS O-acetylase OafA/YrhL
VNSAAYSRTDTLVAPREPAAAIAHARVDQAPRWQELDGVRGLAALLVVYGHILLAWMPAGPAPVFWLRTASGLSWTGVHLFFALSGFLIGGILMAHRGAENYFRVFYARRALRILPLYFLVLAVFFAVRAFTALGSTAAFDFGAVPPWTYLGLVQNFPMAATGSWGPAPLGVTWSVALEEQFYLFLPLWIRLVPVRWQGTSFLLLALSGPLFRAWVPAAHPAFLMPGAFESLAGGTCLAWAFRTRPEVIRANGGRVAAALLTTAGAVGMVGLLAGRELGPWRETTIAAFWVGFLWLVLGAMQTPWTALLRTRFLVAVGGISYGVYLFHVFVNSVIYPVLTGGPARKALGLPGLLVAVLSVGITLGLAWLSYHVLEKRLIAVGRRLVYRRRLSA